MSDSRAFAFFHSASQLMPPPSPFSPFFAARHCSLWRCHRNGLRLRCVPTLWQLQLFTEVHCCATTEAIISSAQTLSMAEKRLQYITLLSKAKAHACTPYSIQAAAPSRDRIRMSRRLSAIECVPCPSGTEPHRGGDAVRRTVHLKSDRGQPGLRISGIARTSPGTRMGVRGWSVIVEKPAEMDWETSKENFQPLKQGRHPTKLLEPVAKAPVKVEGSAEQERRYNA